MLEVGVKAPEIVLNDKDGNEVKLSDFTGKKAKPDTNADEVLECVI